MAEQQGMKDRTAQRRDTMARRLHHPPYHAQRSELPPTVPVVEQVLRRDGGADVVGPIHDEVHALGRRHVLHHQAEVREPGHERL